MYVTIATPNTAATYIDNTHTVSRCYKETNVIEATLTTMAMPQVSLLHWEHGQREQPSQMSRWQYGDADYHGVAAVFGFSQKPLTSEEMWQKKRQCHCEECNGDNIDTVRRCNESISVKVATLATLTP